jgi:organic hydroperoxide reductase OsmC/OhrA
VSDAASAELETYRATVAWNADRDDLRAHTVTLAEQRLAASTAPERGGDPAKADPEQLLVAAASACHMLWFLDFSRRERIRVLTYEDEAEGLMDERRFVRIVLRPAIDFDEEPEPEVVALLHERSHEACFIANSLNCPVEVEPR